MAFAAVVLVEQILQQLLHSDPQIHSFHGRICTLQSSLSNIYPVRRSIRDKVNSLESQIRDTLYETQDLIEAFISNQTHQLEFLQNLKENREKLDPIVAMAEELANSMKKEQQSSGASSLSAQLSKSSRGSKSSKIFGQEEDFKRLKEEIQRETPDRRVITIKGLPGIGKTTLARSIYEDKDVVDRFSLRLWVTVGQEYNAGEVFSKLLASIESRDQTSDASDSLKKAGHGHGSAEQLAVNLYNSLLDHRYLVVVDDVWDTNVWDRIKNYFPNKKSSRIIVTTRMKIIAERDRFEIEMVPLSKETSWELLRETVFGGGHCPPNLLTIGKSIAEHCGGLPLSITVVGGQLSQELENVEYWEIVEEDTKAAAKSEGETYLEILSRSYDHLPGRLKGCFLYMGAFPEDSEIAVSKLLRLWVAEGFLIRAQDLSMENVAVMHLNDLVDRNLVFPLKFGSNGKMRSCGIHDSIRHLAETKSEEERFFVSMKRFPSQRSHSRGEVLSDALKGKETQRRLSVHKNVLMCMEDVYRSAKAIKPARTLLYSGHYHHHPLPFCLTYDWIRVLDALTVHLIEFPPELVELVHLRYLSLTYNGILPSSLSRLKNLVILIVQRHPKIIIMRKSILPVEIWYMKQLRHVLLTECEFPTLPENSSCLLESLQSLSNINADCCDEEFFKNMPHLRKLGIWIGEPGSVNLYLDHLPHLESFKFTVLNPVPTTEIELQRGLMFPGKLKKLSLSGCALPWDRMADVKEFPCLEVLKLRQFAFQGEKWLPEVGQFPDLKWLLIESLDLEYFAADYYCCPSLESLVIRHCYELKEIDGELSSIGTLKRIELAGCNHDVVKCAENIREELKDGGKDLQLRVYSSWGEELS